MGWPVGGWRVKIGIVTPAWNAAATLAAAIASVQAQTHADWRMAVVDDGSTDGTAALAGTIADPRLTVLRQARAGVSAARNRGIAALDVEAFLFLDADDWLAPEALATLSATLTTCPWAVAAVGPYRFADGTGPSLRTRHPMGGDLLRPLLRRNRFVNGGHVLVGAEAVAAAGPFDTGLSYGEDWEFWVRIALCGEFAAARCPAPLLHVRQRAEGAYARLAADPASFEPCMAAIFGNPAIRARLGNAGAAALHRAATAENTWVRGRETIRHGRTAEGIACLRQAVRLSPDLRRLALLAAVPVVLRLPRALRGALRPYTSSGAIAEPGS